MTEAKQISIVIPLLNEDESLPELHKWVQKVMKAHQFSYEIIFIDDGSTDDSWKVIENLKSFDNNVKGIKFQRNYGKSAALHVGFQATNGQVVITMDADLQDSPEEIPELYDMIVNQNYDLVSGWKKKRYDPLSKTIPTKLYNGVNRMVSGIKLHDMNCGLKAYKNTVVKSIEIFGEMHRYIPVIAKAAGFNKIGEKVVVHQERKYGKSKFGLNRFVNGFLDLFTITFITKFGKKPMHFFGLMGTLSFIVGFGIVFWLIVYKLFFNTSFSLIADRAEFYIALAAMIIGTQLFLAGFIAELIGRSSANRNQYLIEKELMTDGKLNITIIGPAHPYRGGIALGNERLANELQSLGHDVNIITFTVQYPSFLFPGKTQYSEAEPPKSLKISREINALNPLNWLKVGKKIRKQNRDIVLFRFWLPLMGPCFGSIARLIKKNKHTKILTLLDNVIPHEGRMGDKLFTKYFTKPQNGYIAMSRQVQKDIAIFSPSSPCLYSPHPLFDNYGKKYEKLEAKNKLNLDSKTNYILFFGLVRDYKGLDLLIEGFTHFDFKKFNVKLLVAGEFYSNEVDYQKLIEKLGLAGHIILINEFIKDEEVGYYFSAADLLAQPYKSATQSGVTQIGYHFEIPMLVTNVGGLPEIVADQVIGYVVRKDPKEIGDAFNNFYFKRRGEAFSANFSNEKKKFTWDKMAEKVLELYQSV